MDVQYKRDQSHRRVRAQRKNIYLDGQIFSSFKSLINFVHKLGALICGIQLPILLSTELS
jgi:hypothetical protein